MTCSIFLGHSNEVYGEFGEELKKAHLNGSKDNIRICRFIQLSGDIGLLTNLIYLLQPAILH